MMVPQTLFFFLSLCRRWGFPKTEDRAALLLVCQNVKLDAGSLSFRGLRYETVHSTVH